MRRRFDIRDFIIGIKRLKIFQNNRVRENTITIGITTSIIVVCLIILPKIILGENIKIDEENRGEIEAISEKEKEKSYIDVEGNNKIKVYRTKTGKIENLDIEEYIVGVVSGEMPIDFHDEAIKAQSIAARTYYFAKRTKKCEQAKGADICDSIHCQVYMNKEERLKAWNKKVADKNYEKVKKLVESTAGLVLTYNNEIIKYPQFFSTSWGKTENSEDVFSSAVPYLKSTTSKGEEVAPRFNEEKTLSNSEFIKIAQKNWGIKLSSKNLNTSIEIVNRTEGGSVNEIKIGNKTVKGKEFRKAFDINSANFTIEYLKDKVKIVTKGYGHGVGMSQWGANIMGKDGSSYEEILTHYYNGIKIKKINYK